MKFWKLGLMALGVVMIPAVARADFDVRPYLSNGKIVTGGFDDATSAQETSAHAFGFTFQEDPLSPYEITDPGFNAEAGGLTAGTQLRFNVLSSLIYWDGTGVPNFSAASGVVTLDLEKFTPPALILDVTFTGSSGVQDGYSIGTVLSDGHIHQHLSSLLGTTDGSLPADGVYAFEMSLVLEGDEGTRSDPFFIVYGDGVSEGMLENAVSYLDAVPEPESLGILGVGVLGVLKRRRWG